MSDLNIYQRINAVMKYVWRTIKWRANKPLRKLLGRRTFFVKDEAGQKYRSIEEAMYCGAGGKKGDFILVHYKYQGVHNGTFCTPNETTIISVDSELNYRPGAVV